MSSKIFENLTDVCFSLKRLIEKTQINIKAKSILINTILYFKVTDQKIHTKYSSNTKQCVCIM